MTVLRYWFILAFFYGLSRLALGASSEAPLPYPGYTPEIEERIRQEAKELSQQKIPLSKLRARPRQSIPSTVDQPVHIMLLFADHWEPSIYNQPWDNSIFESEAARCADYWLNDYSAMAAKHRDADGRKPQHTWFTFQLATGALQRIANCVFQGLGEQEIHLHHGTADDTYNDNRMEFANKIWSWQATLQSYGACISAEATPRTFFGFVHGDWALDNSRLNQGLRQYCGANTELHLLCILNCYADFTFPSGSTTQPAWYDKIFYSFDSDSPKSYSDTTLIREPAAGDGTPDINELMLFEGPGTNGLLSDIDNMHAPSLDMMGLWLDEYVHVPGRDNWVFIKLYTHGAQALTADSNGRANLIGSVADQFYSDIERVYNDGKNYQLHYVTARESYNIARAAMDGMSGNPNEYRDYIVPPPANTHVYCNTTWNLLSFDPLASRIDLHILNTATPPLEIWVRDYAPSSCSILESNTNSDSSFRISDATTSSTATVPLLIRDATPSKYYRIMGGPLSVKKDWALYK